MKLAPIALTTLSLAIAGSAAASGRVTDVDYLKANRCKGLATGAGAGDTTALDATLKAEGRSRADAVLQRGQEELTRAKREASKSDLKERVTAELNGPCMAYLGAGHDVAAATH